MMMKNKVVVVAMLLGLTAPASADNKKVWKGVFVGSLVLTVGGVGTWLHGNSEIDESREKLCAGGAYNHIDSSCPATGQVSAPLTPTQVNELNDQGNRGKNYTYLGTGMVVVGAGLASVALYKGFIADDDEEPKVVVAPTVTRGGGGAALQLRW